MRKLLLGGALAAGILLPASGAQAYGDAPWCLKMSEGEGTVSERCEYRTFEACNAERTLSNAFCVQNSRYLPYWQGRGYGAAQAPQNISGTKKHRRR